MSEEEKVEFKKPENEEEKLLKIIEKNKGEGKDGKEELISLIY